MEMLQKDGDNDYINNIIQTSFWKNQVLNHNLHEDTIPLLIYFDDFEVGNPLGSHAGIIITEDNLRKKKVNMSASEMKCFLVF